MIELEIDDIGPAELIAGGGSSSVYRAEERTTKREVAVKVLTLSLQDDGARRAFEREARALGRLSGHPNIVTLYRVGILESGHPYLVMPFLTRGTLEHAISSDGPMSGERTVAILTDVARALSAAHRERIIHCDVNPKNVLQDDYSRWQLSDFGIARSDEFVQTFRSSFTPAYAAPELTDGGSASIASDLYGLGVSGYTLLLGRPVFIGERDESIHSLLRRIRDDPPQPLDPALPRALRALLGELVSKDPARRPPSAEVVLDRLVTCLDDAAPTSPPASSQEDPGGFERPDYLKKGSPAKGDVVVWWRSWYE